MMKNNKLLLSVSALTIAGAAVLMTQGVIDNTAKYSARNNDGNTFQAQGISGAQQWLNNMRKNTVTGVVDPNDVIRAQQEVLQRYNSNARSAAAVNLNWEDLGPDNVGGRTRAFLIDRDDPNTVYAGGVAGGLWKSTDAGGSWSKINDKMENIIVSSITQAINGDIYFGTGEGLYYLLGTGSGSFIGSGIYKSTDGTNFTRLTSTIPTTANSTAGDWIAVNKLAADPFNADKIYAATNRGLRVTTDGGVTWTNPITASSTSTIAITTEATDVDVATDGTVIVAISPGRGYMSTDGAYQSFVNISTGMADKLPSGNLSRAEFAISPDDPNYMYASLANSANKLLGIYQSIDKGVTWKIIGSGGSSAFEPFGTNGQGNYDNALTVVKGQKTKIILGGVGLFAWTQTADPFIGQWEEIATNFPNSPWNPYYVHSDKHDIVFHPNYATNKTFYVATDGGMFKTIDGGETFIQSNKYYNITQFYSVAFKNNGFSKGAPGNMVMGGTQDNGTQFIDGNGNSYQSAKSVGGGDGGYCEFSFLNPDALFTTVYYGSAARSSNNGSSAAGFYSDRINALAGLGDPGFASFVTPIALFENGNDVNSPDSVTFVADQAYAPGDTIKTTSTIASLPINYITSIAIADNDTVRIQDKYQARLVVGFTGTRGIWMTRDPLDFSITPEWFKIGAASGEVQPMTWSSDGDILYVGDNIGNIYRFSNMNAAIDSATGDMASSQYVIQKTQIGSFSGRQVTSIAVDPNNDDRLLVTLGNYGNSSYVYYSANGTTATSSTGTFTLKQGTGTTKLPNMPVYSAIFDKTNSNTVILGTEFGVWATDNIASANPVWDNANAAQNLPNVPVFMVKQQTLPSWQANNSGNIYIGTHGRGIWKSASLATPTGINDITGSSEKLDGIGVYPNPAVNSTAVTFNLKKSGNVIVKVYNLQGKLVKTINQNNLSSGANKIAIETEELTNGTYLISIVSGAQSSTGKFVVVK